MLAARCWRTLLWRTTVIGVTGSVGKTTAKEAIAGILSTHGRTFRSYRNQNGGLSVALNLLRTRPWHRFAVLEIATTRAGEMLRATRIVRPDIRVVLNVKSTHTNRFPALDDIAREKAQFLAGIGRKQVVVLNIDDFRVAKMSEDKPCKVATFGTAGTADLQASSLSSIWPSRLSFEVRRGNESVSVETQLVGEHWMPSALASIAVALECGMNLTAAATALQQVEPFPARMQPVQVPSGAIFLRDDYLSSLDTPRHRRSRFSPTPGRNARSSSCPISWTLRTPRPSNAKGRWDVTAHKPPACLSSSAPPPSMPRPQPLRPVWMWTEFMRSGIVNRQPTISRGNCATVISFCSRERPVITSPDYSSSNSVRFHVGRISVARTCSAISAGNSVFHQAT